MPTADDLAVLMRKGPLNSITLVAATHRKLEKIERKKTVVVCIILESFCNKALENLEEEPLLGSSLKIKFHTSPLMFVTQTYLQLCLVVVILIKAQFLNSFSTNLLYWASWA